jgi:hypothetical protein
MKTISAKRVRDNRTAQFDESSASPRTTTFSVTETRPIIVHAVVSTVGSLITGIMDSPTTLSI